MDKNILKEVCLWVKDYEEKEEHDLDFTINMKDDAYVLFNKIIQSNKDKLV